jgi:hypothetical protein
MTMNRQDKQPCLKRDSNPRSQRPSDEGLRLRPRDHSAYYGIMTNKRRGGKFILNLDLCTG